MALDPTTRLNEAMSHALTALRKGTPSTSTGPTQVILGGAVSSLTFAGAIAVFGSVTVVPLTIASTLASGIGCCAVLAFRALRRRTSRNRALIAHLDEACEIATKADALGASKKKVQEFANKILDQAQSEMFGPTGQTLVKDENQVDDDEPKSIPSGTQPKASKRLQASVESAEINPSNPAL
jgi:hypothetical protein